MSPDSGLTLLRPALLAVALVALPLLLIGLWGRAARRRERAALGAPRHGARFLPGHSEGRSLLRLVLAALALLFIGVSLAGPVRGWTMRNVSRRGLDLVVCIDTSRSMLVRDIRPDRLSRAIREVSGLIDRLAGDRVALIAFSGDAREVAPLTHDRTTLKELLKRVSPADNLKGGTDLGAALSAALAMFDGRTGAHEAVVLLTDGEDLTGNGLQVAETAAEQGIRVYVVGMGTEQGGKIPVTEGGTERFLADDEGAEIVSALSGSGLEEIARATGGEYLAATRSAAPLEELYQMRISRLDGRTIDGVEWVPHDRYQWALVLALLCMLVEAGLRERTGRSSGRGAVQLRSCALILALPLLGQGSQAFEALDEVRRLSLAEDHAAALEAAESLLAGPAFEAAEERQRAALHYGVGVARHRAGDREGAIDAFLSARDLGGPGDLRLDAAFNVAAVLLELAEEVRMTVPEIGGQPPGPPGAATGGGPLAGSGGAGGGARPAPVLPGLDEAEAEGPDPLEVAEQAYRTARGAHLDRVRLGLPDEDTRANLELIQRRLRELEEIRRQREEQQDQQEQQDQDQSQQSDEGDSEDQQDPQEQDESEQSEQEQDDSEQDPSESEEQSGEEDEQDPSESEEQESSEEEQEPSDQEQEQQAEPDRAEPVEEQMMSREEIQRLLDQLAEIEAEAQRVQAALTRKGRIPVEKDW